MKHPEKSFDMRRFASRLVVSNRHGPTKSYRTRPHFAHSWNEHRYSSRSRVFLILWDEEHNHGITTGLTCREIGLLSGVPLATIKSYSANWVKWTFLTRIDDEPYRYQIDGRGLKFLHIIPQQWLDFYKAQIKTWRLEHQTAIQEWQAKHRKSGINSSG